MLDSRRKKADKRRILKFFVINLLRIQETTFYFVEADVTLPLGKQPIVHSLRYQKLKMLLHEK
jgi:hypothetical protein